MSFAATIRNRRQRTLALVSATALLLSFMTVFAPAAQAHNGTVTWGCTGWSVQLNAYNTGGTNVVTVTVDGTVVANQSSNWSGFSRSGTWDETKDHTLTVYVNAWDDNDQPVYNRGSNGSFSPAWQQGEWSFTVNATQTACKQPPPQSASVAVSAGSCSASSGEPEGTISVTVNPGSSATVNVYSNPGMTNLVGSVSSTGNLTGLSPGTYYWSATPASGYAISGPSSGSVTIENCDVSVTAGGACVLRQGLGVGVISVEISVDNGATVDVSDTGGVIGSFTQSGTLDVPENATYTWSATASPGFTLSGDTSGSIPIEECTPPPVVGASVTVGVGGMCVQDDQLLGHGVLDITVSVAGGATVTVTDSSGTMIGTFSQSTSITVPEGDTYSWTATASDGFEFPPGFATSGTVPIEECTTTVVGASILVTVGGTCVVDDGDGHGVISVTVSVAGGATVVVSDEDGGVVGTFSDDGSVTVPEGASYTWTATANEGFEFPAGFVPSGSVTIGTCSTPDELPFTGVEADALVILGFMLMMAGVVVVATDWHLSGWSSGKSE